MEHCDRAKCLSTNEYSKMIPSFKFIIENLVRIVHDHHLHIRNDRALEFGSRLSLLTSFILAEKVQSIRFADYILQNLTAVQEWIDEKPNAHDWSDLFDQVIHEYHTQTGDMSAKRSVWEQRLREAIHNGGLLKFNINEHDCSVLSEETNHYNVISSNMCLERICATHHVYMQVIKRLYTLLEENGLIILIHELNQTYFNQDGNHHPILPLNRTVVIEALREAGFGDIHDETQDQEDNDVADGNVVMIITAFKLKAS
ncbi:hypothetical protein I4U23_002861 [Adineta vaga]|nr:hypothetical protein I4U23_002861 [Adineta vaga]